MNYWELFKKNWQKVAGVIGAIIGFLFLRQYLQKDLRAELGNQKAQAKDDVLNNDRKHIKEDISNEAKHNQALRDKLDDKAPKAKPDEVEDFYKNRK